MRTTTRDTKAINGLAREWADYIGGFGQAQKVIAEAYNLGIRNSAARELLAACKSARSGILYGGDSKNFDWNVVYEELAAAIAKAEGS